MKDRNFEEKSSYEKALWAEGFSYIAGVDEAGRGPLAGPVIASACILTKEAYFPKLNDSKQLTQELREDLYNQITQSPHVIWSTGIATASEIDRINILQATMLAMKRSIINLSQKPNFILIDGNKAPKIEIPNRTIVKGDCLSISIAAASIIAKVTRDEILKSLDEQWPQYGFKRHKGYGTQEHIEAIKKHGPCPEHRKTFAPIKLMIQNEASPSFI